MTLGGTQNIAVAIALEPANARLNAQTIAMAVNTVTTKEFTMTTPQTTARRPILTMTKGLPGSGKSTWAREMLTRDARRSDARAHTLVRVNKDDIREELFQKDWNYDKEKEVLRTRDFRIGQALSKGLDVISDDTNLAPKHEATLKVLAAKYKCDFIVNDVFLSVPIDECIRRDKARAERTVGEKVIRGMAEDYLDCSTLYLRSGEPQVFLDLDGVMADFDGFIEKELGIENNRENEDPNFWDKARAYKGRLYFDMAPMKGAKALWTAMRPFKPIILTGCPWSIPTAADDKREWVAKYIDPDVLVIPCKSRNKSKWARAGDVLVDDWPKYKDLWEAKGCKFIHYTGQAPQTVVEAVREALRSVPTIMEG